MTWLQVLGWRDATVGAGMEGDNCGCWDGPIPCQSHSDLEAWVQLTGMFCLELSELGYL